jgi:hypothetical protein
MHGSVFPKITLPRDGRIAQVAVRFRLTTTTMVQYCDLPLPLGDWWRESDRRLGHYLNLIAGSLGDGRDFIWGWFQTLILLPNAMASAKVQPNRAERLGTQRCRRRGWSPKRAARRLLWSRMSRCLFLPPVAHW